MTTRSRPDEAGHRQGKESVKKPIQTGTGRKPANSKQYEARLDNGRDLFADGKPSSMANALPIWEASTILTQRRHLGWKDDADGKLCYARQVGNGTGAIHFWVTEDLDHEHPATLAGEAALACLDAFDIRAACMHLLYAGCATRLERPWEQEFVIDDSEIEEYLGLKRRTDKNKQQKLALIEKWAQQPCQVATYISWPKQGRVKGFTVAEGRLWNLIETQYHYRQDQSGNKELDGLSFTIRPGHWARYFLNEDGRKRHSAYYQCGTLSKSLLESVMSCWQHREGAARLMVWLMFKQAEGIYPICVRNLMEIAYGTDAVEKAKSDGQVRKRLVGSWDEDLLTLHDRGWTLAFDPLTYPHEIQPVAFGRGSTSRPRGYYEKMLNAYIWINPPEDWTSTCSQALPQEEDDLQEFQFALPLSGALVKRLREERNWNQAKLSGLVGISQSLLSRIEKGSRSISPELESRFQQCFDIEVPTAAEASPQS